jgi:FHS family L-fucose permease-like MFS transporter
MDTTMPRHHFLHIDSKSELTAWWLITICFALWGVASNVTTPMVGSFSKVFRITTTEASLVSFVYHLGYFCVAIPAALLIQKYNYKLGIVAGLILFAIGTVAFIPSRWLGNYYPFLSAYFIMTCGLSFLQTSCNPYVYSLGDKRYGIQRVNASQTFNALGTLGGWLLAREVFSHMSPIDAHQRMSMPLQQFNAIKDHDLGVMIQPYIVMGIIVVALLLLVMLIQIPEPAGIRITRSLRDRISALKDNKNYRQGVIAEVCYVGAELMCWSFIYQYGFRIFTAEGMTEQACNQELQTFTFLSLLCFTLGRMGSTWLMQWFSPSRMLAFAGIAAMVGVIGTILFTDRNGLYCLVFVSGCMSLMFPTIFGLSMHNLGDHTKMGSAGLIMAILGGSLFPPLQAIIVNSGISLLGVPSINVSFILPLCCFGVVVWYAHQAYIRFRIIPEEPDDDDMLSTPAPIE